MATYIPNATQTTEPVESRTVESAALEFRTLKTSITARIEDVQDGLDTEIVNRIAGDANLQTQNNAQDVRLQAIEAALLVIGEGGLPGTVYVQRLSGTGAQTSFTLNVSVPSSALIDVFINGIYQNKNTFTIVDDVLTFSEAPPAGTDNVEVVVSITIANVETDASLVSFRATDSTVVVRTAQDKMRELVSVKDFGAVGDGVTDDTAAIQTAIDASVGKTLTFPSGSYLVTSGLSFVSWSGGIAGSGVIKFQSGIAISQSLNFTSAKNVNWSGVGLDMGQTSGTLDGDARTDSGFYLKDARDCRFTDITIANVRVGQPIYVDGASSVSPSASHGSKRIFFDNINCVAYSYNTLDVGAGVYIRSEFYTSDGGGIYYAASNGCKKADYTLDATVAYKRTTSDIYFNNCHFENFDRIGYLNVKNVHFTNCKLVNFYTRGHSLSPSCESVTVVGGSISGNAAQINANYACQDLVFSDLVASGSAASTGQRHSLRCGFGTKRVRFSNIVGVGNDVALVYIEGAQDVAFDGVSLNHWLGGNTTFGVNISAGENGNTSSFVTRNITFSNCQFAANYGLKFDSATGTATVEARGIKFTNCHFHKGLQLFNGTQPTGGEIEWVNTTATYQAGSVQDLDSRSFSVYEGSNINMKMWDTFSAGGATTYPTFSTVYFPTTRKDGAGGDATRVPPVLAYVLKSGDTFYQPLIYGIDWFIDATMAANPMINQIRMYTPLVLAAGDTVAIQRIR